MGGGVRQIVLMTLGCEDLPKSVPGDGAPAAGQCAGQIRKLERIAAERGYRLVPGHDPVVWPALTAELAADGAGPSA